MQVPNLLTPDQVIERLLAVVFGSSSAILVLYVLADFVWSWFTRIRLTVKYTGLGVKYGIDTARQVRGRLFELGPVGAVLGFVISVVVLALQAIWLGLSYLIGNGLSWFLIGGRSGMRNGPDWKPFIAGLRWDWISGVYVAGAAVALLLVYQAAFDADWEEMASRAMTILTAPLMFVGGLSGLGAALAGVVSVLYMISHQHDAFAKDFGLKALALAVIAVAYIVASRTIARTPALIAQVWRPIRKRDPEPDSYRHPYPGYPYRARAPRRAIMPGMVIIGVVLAILIGMGVDRGHSNQIAASKPKPHPSAAPVFPPLHTKLICIPGNGAPCGRGTLHWADALALSVQGLTQNVVNRLCAKGYKSKWSQNMAGYIRNPTMCPGPNSSILDGPDFPNGKMTVYFEPPTRKGHWVIAWRLYDHSGRLVRSSDYKARVGSF